MPKVNNIFTVHTVPKVHHIYTIHTLPTAHTISTVHIVHIVPRASKSCRRADPRLRKSFEHLRKIYMFERKTGKIGTFYDSGTRAVKPRISWEEWDYCFHFSFLEVLDFVKDL